MEPRPSIHVPLAHQERPCPCVTITTAASWQPSGVAQRSPSGSDGGLGNRTPLTIGHAGGRFGYLFRGGGHSDKNKKKVDVVAMAFAVAVVSWLVVAAVLVSCYPWWAFVPL